MTIKRGDIVIGVVSRGYSKPRPSVVVQSDFFNETHPSLTLCPITSHLLDAPLYRIAIEPGPGTGLKSPSQVMVDKIMTVPRERIAKKTGRLPVAAIRRIDEAIKLWLSVRLP